LVEWKGLAEKLIPIAVIAGLAVFIITQIKPKVIRITEYEWK